MDKEYESMTINSIFDWISWMLQTLTWLRFVYDHYFNLYIIVYHYIYYLSVIYHYNSEMTMVLWTTFLMGPFWLCVNDVPRLLSIFGSVSERVSEQVSDWPITFQEWSHNHYSVLIGCCPFRINPHEQSSKKFIYLFFLRQKSLAATVPNQTVIVIL